MLTKGDEITVRVVEVDRERGRIGVRRADDPEIAGKTVEELAALAAAAVAAAAATAARGARAKGATAATWRAQRRPRGSGRPRHRDS